MAAPLASLAPVPSPVSDVQSSDDVQMSDNGKPKCITPEDLAWLRDYASQCNGDVCTSPSVAQLQRVHELLVRVKEMESTEHTRAEGTELANLCSLLPGVIKRTLAGNVASEETNFQGLLLEVLCALVELVVAMLSSYVEAGLSTVGTSTSELLEALSFALHPNRPYYKLRRKTSRMCMNVVLPLRLTSVLEVPGFLVRVDGAADDKVHYFCSNMGANHNGEACECCEPPVNADAVIVYLHWLLAKTTSGSGYEYMLIILGSSEELTLATVELLLRPVCQVLRINTGSNSWREGYIRHMEVNCETEFKNCCSDMCSALLQYLNDTVPDMIPISCPSYELVRLKLELFSVVVNCIGTIACSGSSAELDVIRDSLLKLQVKVCERLLNAQGYICDACTYITRVIQAPPAPVANSGNGTLSTLIWLEEKDVIWRLLSVRWQMAAVPTVEQFVRILAKKGVVVKEDDFLDRLELIAKRPPVPPVTNEQCNAADLINVTMLEELDISAYSDYFLEYVLYWLETREANFVIHGVGLHSRIFQILRKLLTNDKHRRWEKRFCTLLRKYATTVLSNDIVECLRAVADHYSSSHHVPGSSKDSYVEMDEEQAAMLETCTSADMVTSISRDMNNVSLNHTKEYVEKVQTWKNKEIELDVHLNATSEMTAALSTTFPYSRHETAKKCLERLVFAQKLIGDLNPNEQSTSASVMTSAMSPELQALQALKNESLLHCKVIQQVEELNKRHVQKYDAFMQEQYEKLVKLTEAYCKEKEDVIWDALNHKAKALASVERASVGKDEVMSSEDILKRLFQNAENACKEMEAKLSQVEEERKESLPRVECAVCFSEFSLKRKRACLDPCGHASACVDCATQEWKRTRKCSLCNTSIQKPIPLPSKLFF